MKNDIKPGSPPFSVYLALEQQARQFDGDANEAAADLVRNLMDTAWSWLSPTEREWLNGRTSPPEETCNVTASAGETLSSSSPCPLEVLFRLNRQTIELHPIAFFYHDEAIFAAAQTPHNVIPVCHYKAEPVQELHQFLSPIQRGLIEAAATQTQPLSTAAQTLRSAGFNPTHLILPPHMEIPPTEFEIITVAGMEAAYLCAPMGFMDLNSSVIPNHVEIRIAFVRDAAVRLEL